MKEFIVLFKPRQDICIEAYIKLTVYGRRDERDERDRNSFDIYLHNFSWLEFILKQQDCIYWVVAMSVSAKDTNQVLRVNSFISKSLVSQQG